MRYYEQLAKYQREGFDVVVDKTYEDMHPSETFDDTEYEIAEICRKIDNGTYEWFMLRVRVLAEGVELGSQYVGGCLYEDANEVLTDGLAEDLIQEAIAEARDKLAVLTQKVFK